MSDKRNMKLVDRLTLPAINTAIKLNHDATVAAITDVSNALVVTSFNARTGAITLLEDDVRAVTTYPIRVVDGGTGADLSATGGANRVLMQTSAGASVSVAQLAASNLSNGTVGSGSVVLASGITGTGSAVLASGTTGVGVVVRQESPTLFGAARLVAPPVLAFDAVFFMQAYCAGDASAASKSFGCFVPYPVQFESSPAGGVSLSDALINVVNCTYSATATDYGLMFTITSSAAGACSAHVAYTVDVDF